MADENLKAAVVQELRFWDRRFEEAEDVAETIMEIVDARLTAENERLRAQIAEAIKELADPAYACDHGGNREAALELTISNALFVLRGDSAVNDEG